MWLSVPTTRKLDSRWENGWTINEMLNPVMPRYQMADEHKLFMSTRRRVIPKLADLSLTQTDSKNEW